MNLKQVLKKIETAAEKGIIYITGQRVEYPKGYYIVEPLLDDEEELIFEEFDTFRKFEDATTGNELSLKGFTLFTQGRNVETGHEEAEMQVTADRKVIEQMKKDPKTLMLVKTVTRERSNGNGSYQIMQFVRAGKKKELSDFADKLLTTETIEE